MSNEEKETLKLKIRSKVITHELIHASSFNGISTGFTFWHPIGQQHTKTNNEIIANSNELNLPYNSNLNQTDLTI